MLGRGLESLIPKRQSQSSSSPQDEPQEQDDKQSLHRESVFLVEIDKVKPNPYQPRREFDKDALRELSESIKRHGILQPLVVTKVIKEVPHGEQVEYQLVAGERRLRAAKMVSFERVPVIIRDAPPKAKLELSLIENVQREDLNPMEKALAFNQLVKQFHVKHYELASRIGKSREYVTNALRLIKLPPRIQQALKDSEISENHARAILMIADPKQQAIFLDTIIREGLTSKDAEKKARDIQLTTVGAPSSPMGHYRHGLGTKTYLKPIPVEIKQLEEKIRAATDISAVSVKFFRDKPKVTFHFESRGELLTLLSRIKKD